MFLPDYASAENVLGKNASGLLNVNSRQNYVVNIGEGDSDVQTVDLTSSVANKDTYLRMLKNKDQFTRKIVMGGGFEVQNRSKIPTLQPGQRGSKSQLEPAGQSRHGHKQPGSMHIQSKQP